MLAAPRHHFPRTWEEAGFSGACDGVMPEGWGYILVQKGPGESLPQDPSLARSSLTGSSRLRSRQTIPFRAWPSQRPSLAVVTGNTGLSVLLGTSSSTKGSPGIASASSAPCWAPPLRCGFSTCYCGMSHRGLSPFHMGLNSPGEQTAPLSSTRSRGHRSDPHPATPA